ncbi:MULTISPECIES: DUF488 family protein [Arthrobacter]|uniref:DUF488 domain-containing protein n=1 Tax=Arthrobacter TaxID=1663 RepID=UPI000D13145A|nr:MULTISPECIES: DUF488 family protein [Arthrobacter]PSS44888.1 DUF488 domain-containing protein [Arthrobacter woluwensis]
MTNQQLGRLTTARIYDEPVEGRYRILVDRLWPRGVSKEKAALDEWLKDIAPSGPLRTEFAHMASRFEEFTALYREELDEHPVPVDHVVGLLREGRDVELLYAAKDREINHAQVLRSYLLEHLE